MHYAPVNSGQQRILAVLAAMQLYPGRGPTNMTTSEVVSELPKDPSRKRTVSALRALEEAGYVFQTTRYVSVDTALNRDQAGRLIAWQITPTGLRVALGVLA